MSLISHALILFRWLSRSLISHTIILLRYSVAGGYPGHDDGVPAPSAGRGDHGRSGVPGGLPGVGELSRPPLHLYHDPCWR